MERTPLLSIVRSRLSSSKTIKGRKNTQFDVHGRVDANERSREKDFEEENHIAVLYSLILYTMVIEQKSDYISGIVGREKHRRTGGRIPGPRYAANESPPRFRTSPRPASSRRDPENPQERAGSGRSPRRAACARCFRTTPIPIRGSPDGPSPLSRAWLRRTDRKE